MFTVIIKSRKDRNQMIRKKFVILFIALAIAVPCTFPAHADTASITMENCGAYLFEWRPVDCGDGQYFVILAGGNSISESDVILNRGYDYAYTFEPMQYSRPWGQVPALVNVDGLWGIPENWLSMPEGSQQVTQIVLKTNNKNLPTDKRTINVVHMPGGVNYSDLPADVRKYLINVDGSDAGAYKNTETSGWVKNEEGKWRYRKPDGTFVRNSWLNLNEKRYYMDENGVMLSDTTTPDGIYINAAGEATKFTPGWYQNERGWKYVLKNGYFAASTWIKDVDDKWYYFDIGGYMRTDYDTPDGYHVGPDGVWDGNATTSIANTMKLGPGAQKDEIPEDALINDNSEQTQNGSENDGTDITT